MASNRALAWKHLFTVNRKRQTLCTAKYSSVTGKSAALLQQRRSKHVHVAAGPHIGRSNPLFAIARIDRFHALHTPPPVVVIGKRICMQHMYSIATVCGPECGVRRSYGKQCYSA